MGLFGTSEDQRGLFGTLILPFGLRLVTGVGRCMYSIWSIMSLIFGVSGSEGLDLDWEGVDKVLGRHCPLAPGLTGMVAIALGS